MISFKSFSSVMPRDRFMNILAFFHVCDNLAQPNGDATYDPTFKIRTISSLVNGSIIMCPAEKCL